MILHHVLALTGKINNVLKESDELMLIYSNTTANHTERIAPTPSNHWNNFGICK
jgi:hypothetical protein